MGNTDRHTTGEARAELLMAHSDDGARLYTPSDIRPCCKRAFSVNPRKAALAVDIAKKRTKDSAARPKRQVSDLFGVYQHTILPDPLRVLLVCVIHIEAAAVADTRIYPTGSAATLRSCSRI